MVSSLSQARLTGHTSQDITKEGRLDASRMVYGFCAVAPRRQYDGKPIRLVTGFGGAGQRPFTAGLGQLQVRRTSTETGGCRRSGLHTGAGMAGTTTAMFSLIFSCLPLIHILESCTNLLAIGSIHNFCASKAFCRSADPGAGRRKRPFFLHNVVTEPLKIFRLDWPGASMTMGYYGRRRVMSGG